MTPGDGRKRYDSAGIPIGCEVRIDPDNLSVSDALPQGSGEVLVKGDIVTVGGTLERDPAAVVKGTVQVVSVGHRFPHLGGLYAWARSALFKGRLLSFASGAGCRPLSPRRLRRCQTGQATMPAGTVTVMLRRLALGSFPRRAAQPSCSCIQAGRPAGMSASGIARRSPAAQVSP